MGWIKSLFGSRDSRSSPPSTSTPRPRARTNANASPYESVSSGLDAWSAQDFPRAEQLLRQGVDSYRRADPSGTDFALGRLGAFLLEQNRIDEAAEVLEEAIAKGTDIPALWFDYLEIMARRKDIEGLFDTAMLSVGHIHGGAGPYATLLAYARSADRDGDSVFAEAVANRVVDAATAAQDREARWAAIGDLGHILERADRLDEALNYWETAFADGSNDPTTANRLSMHLERARDYSNAIAIIEEAFHRELPANVEEQLRKRLERCKARVEGRKRSDVTAFSVREGEGMFELVFQTRVSPPLRTVSTQGAIARGFGVSKAIGTLVDLSLSEGAEVSRTTDLPSFSEIHFSPSGWGIGTERTGRIGEGVTHLSFIAPSGSVARLIDVPDATSEIALGPDLWYVGCRDGRLYAFSLEGNSLWKWETPGARVDEHHAYSRPCPYYVSSDGERASIASMGDVYCIGPTGKTLWHCALPKDPPDVHSLSIPLSGHASATEAYAELRLAPGASPTEVKRAYRQRAMDTHPDRNPNNPDSAKQFQQVHAAYESIMSGGSLEATGPTIEFSISFEGMNPLVSHLIATRESVFVGSSDGKLYILNSEGGIIKGTHALGEYQVWPFVDRNGALIAAWCDGTIFYFEDDNLSNLVEFKELPEGIGAFGDGLYLWRRTRLDLVDRTGHVIWSAEFSKNISDVSAHGESLLCAAGVLAAFRRTAP